MKHIMHVLYALLKLTVGNVSHESHGLSIIPHVQLYTALTLKKCVAKWSETFKQVNSRLFTPAAPRRFHKEGVI